MTPSEKQKPNRALELLGPVLILATLFTGGGALVESHFDDAAAAKADRIRTADQLKERTASNEKIALLEGIIRDERNRYAKDTERRHKHDLLAVSDNKRVRFELEAVVSESRTNAQRCSANTDRIAAIAIRALDTIDQAAAGIDELEKRNAAVESKLAEWERYDPEQVMVVERH